MQEPYPALFFLQTVTAEPWLSQQLRFFPRNMIQVFPPLLLPGTVSPVAPALYSPSTIKLWGFPVICVAASAKFPSVLSTTEAESLRKVTSIYDFTRLKMLPGTDHAHRGETTRPESRR